MIINNAVTFIITGYKFPKLVTVFDVVDVVVVGVLAGVGDIFNKDGLHPAIEHVHGTLGGDVDGALRVGCGVGKLRGEERVPEETN